MCVCVCVMINLDKVNKCVHLFSPNWCPGRGDSRRTVSEREIEKGFQIIVFGVQFCLQGRGHIRVHYPEDVSLLHCTPSSSLADNNH